MRSYEAQGWEYQESAPHPAGKGVLFQRTKTWKCGDVLEAEIYPVLEWEYRREAGARKKSTEQMRRCNDRRQERYLRRLMNLNFGPGDLMLNSFTSDKPCAFEEFEKRVDKLIRKLRQIYRAAGVELKYILHLEQTGQGDGVRYHVHGIINRGPLDRDQVEALWPWGTANVDRVKRRDGGLNGYAEYMMQKKDGQQTAGKRRFRASRNLKKPTATVSDHKFSRSQAAKIERMAREDAQRMFEKKYPGWRLVSCKVRYSDFLPGVYVYAEMERTSPALRATSPDWGGK